jgi:hypothetical protein
MEQKNIIKKDKYSWLKITCKDDICITIPYFFAEKFDLILMLLEQYGEGNIKIGLTSTEMAGVMDLVSKIGEGIINYKYEFEYLLLNVENYIPYNLMIMFDWFYQYCEYYSYMNPGEKILLLKEYNCTGCGESATEKNLRKFYMMENSIVKDIKNILHLISTKFVKKFKLYLDSKTTDKVATFIINGIIGNDLSVFEYKRDYVQIANKFCQIGFPLDSIFHYKTSIDILDDNFEFIKLLVELNKQCIKHNKHISQMVPKNSKLFTEIKIDTYLFNAHIFHYNYLNYKNTVGIPIFDIHNNKFNLSFKEFPLLEITTNLYKKISMKEKNSKI